MHTHLLCCWGNKWEQISAIKSVVQLWHSQYYVHVCCSKQLLDDVSSKKDKIYDDYYHAAMKIDELKKVSGVCCLAMSKFWMIRNADTVCMGSVIPGLYCPPYIVYDWKFHCLYCHVVIVHISVMFSVLQHNTELTRRSEDTSRAYEQEKKVCVVCSDCCLIVYCVHWSAYYLRTV